MNRSMDVAHMQARIRDMLANTGEISNAASLARSQDVFAAGLTGFTAVQLMLELEAAFGVRFPADMLNCRSFSSVESIETCVAQLLDGQRAA